MLFELTSLKVTGPSETEWLKIQIMSVSAWCQAGGHLAIGLRSWPVIYEMGEIGSQKLRAKGCL